MASQQIQSEAQKHGENIGLRVARSLSKRMSIGGSSKDTTSKGSTDQSGTGQQALDKGEQIKQSTDQSGIDQRAIDKGEQYMQGTGQSSTGQQALDQSEQTQQSTDQSGIGQQSINKGGQFQQSTGQSGTDQHTLDKSEQIQQSTDQSGIGQRTLDKGEQIKDETAGGNFGSAKGLAGKGESTNDAVGGGSAAGAFGSSGLNQENLSPASAENTGRRMFGSISVGPPEPNDDIRRGPIFPGPGDQRQTRNAASGGAGSSTKGGLSQDKVKTTGSQAQSQGQGVGQSPGGIAWAQNEPSPGQANLSQTKESTTKSSTMSQTHQTSSQTSTQGPRKESSVLDPSSDTFNANEAGGISPTQKTMSNKSDGQYGAMKDDTAKIGDASKEKDKLSGHGLLGQAKEKFNQTLGSQRHKSSSGQSKSNQAKAGGAAATGMAATGLTAQGNSAGGTFGGGSDSISEEFNTMSGISDDVFSDGVAGKTAAKGMGQGLAGKSSAPKKKSGIAKGMTTGKTPQASKQYQQGGIGAVGAGQGINKGRGALGQGSSDNMSTNAKSQNLSKQGGITMGGMSAMSGSADSDNGAFGGSGGHSAAMAGGAAGLGAGALGTGLKQGSGQKGMDQGGIRSEEATSSTTGLYSGRVVQNLGGSGYRVTVLQEKVQSVTQKCKTQLGLSANEITQHGPTVDAFFDAVAAERLRWMPRDGSRLDCSLRWASRLAYAVDALRESVGAFAPGANDAAKMIWGFLVLLLEVR